MMNLRVPWKAENFWTRRATISFSWRCYLFLHISLPIYSYLFFVNAFKGDISYPSILDSIRLSIPSTSIRDYSAFLFIVISKPDPLQDAFLPVQFVGTITSLAKTVLCLRILLSILLVLFYIFLCSLCSWFVLSCNWLSCCCQAR